MLVLSRKRDEKIVIRDDIVITIVEIRGDKVRLGIEAPQDVPVHRQEVYDAIKRNEKCAPGVVHLVNDDVPAAPPAAPLAALVRGSDHSPGNVQIGLHTDVGRPDAREPEASSS